MKKIRLILKKTVFILFIILAAFGVGAFGPISSHRERYLENEVKITYVKEEDEEDLDGPEPIDIFKVD